MSKMKWKAEGKENPLLIQAALKQAALDTFSMQSFGEASLNEIIRKGSLNKGSFYYRFYDKLDLYLSLLWCLGMEKMKLIQDFDRENSREDLFRSITRKATISLQFAKERPLYYAFWKKILAEPPSIRTAINEEFGDITYDELSQMVAAAKERREVRRDIPDGLMVNVLTAILQSLDTLLTEDSSDEEIETLVYDTMRLLQQGFTHGC